LLVPVSRKRKPKKSKSTRVVRPRADSSFELRSGPKPADAMADLFALRREYNARREQLAAEAAAALVSDLAEYAVGHSYPEVEDELCARMGLRLRVWADGPAEDDVDPNTFGAALLPAAAEAVGRELQDTTDPEGWRGAWQVLTAVTRTVAGQEATHLAIAGLRGLAGAQVLPEPPDGPAATSPILWARDAYGSRFGVMAAFSTIGGSDRWYLWDVDACGYQPFTVHSGYYATQELALTAWRAGVGPMAADAVTEPVDNSSLLAELLFPEEAIIRPGGDSAEQFAEYHRGARLADTALAVLSPIADYRPVNTSAVGSAEEFVAWLRYRRPGEPMPAEAEEIAEELSESWRVASPAALYSTCSPHRVALTVAHLREYYEDAFAEQLVDVLPDWIAWLATRTEIAHELVDRCLPYLQGRPYPGTEAEKAGPNYRARVLE